MTKLFIHCSLPITRLGGQGSINPCMTTVFRHCSHWRDLQEIYVQDRRSSMTQAFHTAHTRLLACGIGPLGVSGYKENRYVIPHVAKALGLSQAGSRCWFCVRILRFTQQYTMRGRSSFRITTTRWIQKRSKIKLAHVHRYMGKRPRFSNVSVIHADRLAKY